MFAGERRSRRMTSLGGSVAVVEPHPLSNSVVRETGRSCLQGGYSPGLPEARHYRFWQRCSIYQLCEPSGSRPDTLLTRRAESIWWWCRQDAVFDSRPWWISHIFRLIRRLHPPGQSVVLSVTTSEFHFMRHRRLNGGTDLGR